MTFVPSKTCSSGHLQYARSLQRSNLKPEKYPQSIVATGRPIKKLLEAEHVTLADRSVNDVSFYARAGEITGIAGLVGCGQSEIIRAVVGLEPIESGMVRVRGAEITSPTPAAMTKQGVCYFPSDRVAEGLALARPVRENDLNGGARFARFLAPPDPAAPQRAAHRAGDRRETVAAPAAHRTRGCVVFRQQSAENPVGARADALHCGVPFRRAHRGG